MHALADFVAAVQGAIYAIVAIDGWSAVALSTLAGARTGAWIVVITGPAVGRLVVAAVDWAAKVGCTWVFIVAASTLAKAIALFSAEIVDGAWIAVVAWLSNLSEMRASAAFICSKFEAIVYGAWIVVVALGRGAWDAGTGSAKVTIRAGVLVIAGDVGLVEVRAFSAVRLAGVGGTVVAIVT
jgi:hypothetical protein